MRVRSISIAITMLAGLLAFTPNAIAADEVCKVHNLGSYFDEEYFEGVKWDNTKGVKTITWTANVTSIKGEAVTRAMNETEFADLRASFNAWDMALDTVNFKEVNDSASADVLFGLTALQNNGYWTIELDGGFRSKGTIRISTTTPIFLTQNGFKTIALSEIGNLLGLGDIQHPVGFHSVMEDPDTPPFGVIPLEDTDIEMMRQFYGESTCHSSWSQELRAAKAAAAEKQKADAEAAAKAQAEADAKAKAEAQAAAVKAEEERIAKIQAEAAAAAKANAIKLITITCVKGKLIKKVVAKKPVCPKGYTKKK